MDRREMLWTLGVAGAVAAPAAVVAQESAHVHGEAAQQTLIAASSNCVATGETCAAHCQQLMADGDKSFGACAKTASEMVTVCGALRTLAAQNAPSLPKLAAVAIDTCRRCEAQCRKHEKVHQQCKECADACAACAAECKKIVGA